MFRILGLLVHGFLAWFCAGIVFILLLRSAHPGGAWAESAALWIAGAGWVLSVLLARYRRLPRALPSLLYLQTALILTFLSGVVLLLALGCLIWLVQGHTFDPTGILSSDSIAEYRLFLWGSIAGGVLCVVFFIRRGFLTQWLAKPIYFHLSLLSGFLAGAGIALLFQIVRIGLIVDDRAWKAMYDNFHFLSCAVFGIVFLVALVWASRFRNSPGKAFFIAVAFWFLSYGLYRMLTPFSEELRKVEIREVEFLVNRGWCSQASRFLKIMQSAGDDFDLMLEASQTSSRAATRCSESDLKKLLHSSNPAARLWAAFSLIESRDVFDAEVESALKAFVEGESPLYRIFSLSILAEKGVPPDVDSFRQDLKDSDPQVRALAATLFRHLGSETSVPALVPLLGDPEGTVFFMARYELEQAGDELAEADLRSYLPGTNSDFAFWGAWMLDRRNVYEDASRRILITVVEAPNRGAALIAAEILARRDAVSPPDQLLKDAIVAPPSVWHYLTGYQVLRWTRESESTPSLEGIIRHTDPEVRRVAAKSLYTLAGVAAVPTLIEALKDSDSEVRLNALESLHRIGDSSSFDPVVKCLKDPYISVRKKAMEIAGSLFGDRALPYLMEARTDPFVQKELVVALSRIGGIEGNAAAREILKSNDLRWYEKEKALETLSKDELFASEFRSLLSEPDVGLRRAAASAASEASDPDWVDALAERVSDTTEDPEVRWLCAVGLAKQRHPLGIRMVEAGLDTSSTQVRFESADLLKQIADPGTLPVLISKVHDSEPEIVGRILQAIGNIGNRETIPVVLSKFQRSRDPVIRSHAARALGKLHAVEAAGDLTAALSDASVPAEVKVAVVEALGELGISTAVPRIASLLETSDYELTEQCILALGKIGDPSAVPHLAAYLDHRSFGRQSIRAVARIGGPESLSILLKQLESKTPLKAEIISALGSSRDSNALPAFTAALHDSNRDVREAAASALGEIGTGESVHLLIPALKDADARVRESAAHSLGRLKGAGAVPAFYQGFLQTGDVYLLNVIRGNLWFSERSEDWIASRDGLIRAAAYYLHALEARENRAPETQLQAAQAGLTQLGNLRTGLTLLLLWEKTNAEIQLGRQTDAANTIDAAAGIFRQLSGPGLDVYQELFQERTLYWSGEVFRQPGMDAGKAIRSYETALSLIRGRMGSEDLRIRDQAERLEALIRTGLGLVQLQKGRSELEQAVTLGRVHETQDSVEMANEEQRYLALAQQKMSEGDYEEAHRLMEELQLRRNQFQQKKLRLTLAEESKNRILEEYRVRSVELERLKERLAILKKPDLSAAEQGPGPVFGVAVQKEGALRRRKQESLRLEEELSEKKRELRRYVSDLKKTHPDLASLLSAEPIDLSMVQQVLPQDVALIQYLVLPEKLVAFIVRSGSIETKEIRVSRDSLKGVVMGFREDLQSAHTEYYLESAAELYGILLGPLESGGHLEGVRTLGIAPNSFLHYIPFGALRRGSGDSQFLAQRYSLFYVHSSSLLWVAMDRGQESSVPQAELVAFSNPDGSLPNAEGEVEFISELFDRKQVFKRERATSTILEKASPRQRVVHMATHGKFDDEDSTRSFVVLADRKLTVEDIWGLPLQGVALTTLSACETGRGKILSGDDVISVESAFIYAGSPSVVATLWPVSDQSSAVLMQHFYSQLRKGRSRAEALAVAQDALVRSGGKTSHPFYWSGFVLHGDWR